MDNANPNLDLTDALIASGFTDGLRELAAGRPLPTGWVDASGKRHPLDAAAPDYGVIVTDAEVADYRRQADRMADETGKDYLRTDKLSDASIRRFIIESKLTHAADDLEVLECLAAVDPRYAAELDQARRAHPEAVHALACGTDDDSGDDAADGGSAEARVLRHADRLYAECVNIARRHLRIADDVPDALDLNIARILHQRYGGQAPSSPRRARQSITRRLRTLARRQLAQKERQGSHDSAD